MNHKPVILAPSTGNAVGLVLFATCVVAIVGNVAGLRGTESTAEPMAGFQVLSILISITGFLATLLLTPILMVWPGQGDRSLKTGALAFAFLVASSLTPAPFPSQSKARNAGVAANVNTVRLAIEQYATDKGHYPPTDNWQAAIGVYNYLPGNRLPRNPWSKQPQVIGLKRDGLPLPSAAQLAAGAAQPALRTSLGDGQVAPEGPHGAQDYGAILYDLDPKSDTYVLYGIGRKGREAVLVAVVTNL